METRSGLANEAEVIARAQSGDEAAFETLYNTYYRQTYSRCLQMVKEPGLAEDLTQDTFLHLFRSMKQFRGEAAFSTWLYRIATNIVLMYLRKRRLNVSSLDEEGETEKGIVRRQFGKVDVATTMSPERIAFWAAFDLLPGGYQTVLFLHDIQGYEHAEIAQFLGCTIGTSKSQLFRARKRLLARLNPKRPMEEFEVLLGAQASKSSKFSDDIDDLLARL